MKDNLPHSNTAAVQVDDGDRFKIAQAIYNAVTGKTETLSRPYGKDYLVTRDDIHQLHEKLLQACSQWEVLQKNCNITVHHFEENKEVFSSFERFKVYDQSRTSPTESVVFEFNILLKLPGTEKPQPYKIVVRSLSKIAMIKRMEKEMAPPSFFRFFSAGNIVIEVEYVDYVVARNMIGVLESWVSEIEIDSRYSWARPIQRFSHWIPPIIHASMIGIFGFALFSATPAVLPSGSESSTLAQWLILGASSLILAGLLGRAFGRMAETGIDRITSISAIKLNKGDDRLIERFKTRNRLRLLQAVSALVFAVAQGIVANGIISLLTSMVKN